MATEDKGYIVEVEEKILMLMHSLEMALNTLQPLIADLDALLDTTIKEIRKI